MDNEIILKCCDCEDIADFEFQGKFFCSECLDDLLNRKFSQIMLYEKAEILNVEIKEL